MTDITAWAATAIGVLALTADLCLIAAIGAVLVGLAIVNLLEAR
jgi:hypothetical protein